MRKFAKTIVAIVATILVSTSNSASALTVRDNRQIQCMAENIYHEAGNQSQRGMIAIGNVVMNRVQSGKFANTPCAVIRQRFKGHCQFSWVCNTRNRIRDMAMFRHALEVAEMVYYKRTSDLTRGSTFYHAIRISPGWFSSLRQTVKIGDHIFYKR